MKKHLLLILLMMFLIIFNLSPLYSQENTSEDEVEELELVKRTVIVLDFVYLNEDINYTYLTSALSDSITSALINTENFDMSIPRERVNEMAEELGITQEEYYTRSAGVRIANELGADVAVIGEYHIVNDTIQIIVDAIDIPTEQVAVSMAPPYDISVSVKIIDAIDEISRRLAEKMAEALKPQPPKVITEYVREQREYQFIFPNEEYETAPSSVSIIGDFTGWQPIEMRNINGDWKANLDIDILSKNDFEYRYLINGEPEVGTRSIRFKIEEGVLVEDKKLFFFNIGFRPGAYFYFWNDYIADRSTSSYAIALLYFKMNIPIWEGVDLGYEIVAGWFGNEIDGEKNPITRTYEIPINHFPLLVGITYDFTFLNDLLFLYPRLGAGALISYFQIDSTTGEDFSETRTDASFMAYAGLSFGYNINQFVSILIHADIYTQVIGDDRPMWYVSVGPGLQLNF